MTPASPLPSLGGALTPVWYRGLRFREPAERDWAVCLDRLGVAWVRLDVPPPALIFSPAFWLPASRQYVSVTKACNDVFTTPKVAQDLFRARARRALPRPYTGDDTPDLRLILADARGQYRGYDPVQGACGATQLFVCARCDGRWFLDASMGWACQCCGAYDGDGHIAAQYPGRLRDFPHVEVPWTS